MHLEFGFGWLFDNSLRTSCRFVMPVFEVVRRAAGAELVRSAAEAEVD